MLLNRVWIECISLLCCVHCVVCVFCFCFLSDLWTKSADLFGKSMTESTFISLLCCVDYVDCVNCVNCFNGLNCVKCIHCVNCVHGVNGVERFVICLGRSINCEWSQKTFSARAWRSRELSLEIDDSGAPPCPKKTTCAWSWETEKATHWILWKLAVYMNAYIYICMCICICMYIYVYIHIYVYIYIHIYKYI